jgi:hypothetical protein
MAEWYGKGERVWPDGFLLFEGEFLCNKNGKFDGKGKNISPDGASSEGDFKDCEFDGEDVISCKALYMSGKP